MVLAQGAIGLYIVRRKASEGHKGFMPVLQGVSRIIARLYEGFTRVLCYT